MRRKGRKKMTREMYEEVHGNEYYGEVEKKKYRAVVTIKLVYDVEAENENDAEMIAFDSVPDVFECGDIEDIDVKEV